MVFMLIIIAKDLQFEYRTKNYCCYFNGLWYDLDQINIEHLTETKHFLGFFYPPFDLVISIVCQHLLRNPRFSQEKKTVNQYLKFYR